MSVTATRRPTFHALTVSGVEPVAEDAVAVEFAVPAALRETFAFAAGQHVTVRRQRPEVRRSYSICSTPGELATHGRLRIGVRQVPGGVFSTFAAKDLRAGDTVLVLPPLGSFTTAFDPGRVRRYGAVAAGSGITPVLSLASTALAVEPRSRFTVVYGNRTARSAMFTEELADLKDRYPQRLHLVYAFSREQRDTELLSGRLDTHRLRRIVDELVDPDGVDEWFLCGPYGLVTAARDTLGGRAAKVHVELFHAEEAVVARPRPAAPQGATTEVTIRLDGRTSTVRMARDERVLDAALRVRPELPYACKGGVCSTCRARLVDGGVDMVSNFALEPDEVARGDILTCQAVPLTDAVVVDFDM
ncbi:phenylacetic acid degradation protein [Virgisporangium aliadipatigenens]|uniref:Phenylacetic acid degradation protein n=1 Tax=Virgisporangium aliadipatigenens TaxID=741659 RepID=A0A8J3YNX0_9ACTN|nr:1,2-phenylacetyl-CoA epoxidase subunit PaaE [Virgisporangium aliadipatigenens]GIJ47330.1 phenylacetic acid degradation protein [Virgisporangium aliadipatigenens]